MKSIEQADTWDILLLFEEKGACLNALLGDYGNIRFIEKLKGEFFSDSQKYLFS